MKPRFTCYSTKAIARLIPHVLVAALTATLCAAPAEPEEKAEKEFHEKPAQLFIENFPVSKELRPALPGRSVPVFLNEDAKDGATPAHLWKAIGPAPINGSTANREDPVSGRATMVAVHPTNPEIVYLGTAQGGLWRTLNGGASWTQLMDNAFAGPTGTPLAIGSVAISPSDPNTVFVGTGEGNLSIDSFFGSGFYIITNAGTFNPVVNGPYNAQASDAADIFTGRSIVAIAVDPTNSNNVFVATSSGVGGITSSTYPQAANRGVYRSTNALGGVNGTGTPTWTRLQVGGTSANTITTSLVMEPGNPNNLIVATLGQSPADPVGLYRTTNALAQTPTFTQSLPLPLGIASNAKLAIAKVGSAVTVYATTGEPNPSGQGRLYKSTDGGASFTPLAANSFAGSQGFYNIPVAVDPTNGNNMSFGGQVGPNIYRYSRDGGATFPFSITGLHADVHFIAYAPSNPNIIYHLNDGGVWRSNDAGLNWTSLNNGTLNTFQYSGIALHPTDRNFTFAGTQDNGTHLIRPDGSGLRMDGGDGGYSLIDQNATDTASVTLYHTYFNQTNNLIGTARTLTVPCAVDGGWAFRGVFGGGEPDPTLSCDGTPTDIFNGIALTDPVNFYAPMVLGPGNPNTWYFGTDKLYRSPNRADTATPVSQSFGVTVSAIAISPQDDNVRILGLQNGRVFATTAGSPTLVQIAGAGATNGTATTPAVPVNRIMIDPNNKNVALIAFGGFGTSGAPMPHVWKTTNLDALNAVPAGNVVFTPMSTGLPDMPANALAIDAQTGSASANSTDIYVGTDNGVFASTDGGASWSRFGSGFPRVSVFGLEIQNQSRLIRAATHGRGMYETFVNRQPAAPQLSQAASRKTHGGASTFDVNMPLTGTTGVEPRTRDQSGNHTVVFTFTAPVTGGNATSSAGAVSNTTFNGNEMIVTLSGVGPAQIVSVTANNVTGSTGTLPSVTVNMAFLEGDIDANRAVTATDLSLVKSRSGQVGVDSMNFRTDVTVNGMINSSDVGVVKSRSGSAL